jgi:putative tryptophan/tyrosine transport system substrate-binding protein
LGGKRLELLKEVVPKLAHVAFLYESGNPNLALEVKEVLPPAAQTLGVTLQPLEVRGADDLDRAFAAVTPKRPAALYALGGVLLTVNQKRIIDFATKSRLPAIFTQKKSVEVGGLMSYSADQTENYRRVAYYVDRILKGSKPADLPVEQPMKFEFVINLKTAKQIGLEIPQWTLMKADRVIK